MDCPYPEHISVGYEGRCQSTNCPSRDDCPGLSDNDIETVVAPAVDVLGVLDEIQHRLNAVERSLSELKRAVTLWCESVEGGDRGRD